MTRWAVVGGGAAGCVVAARLSEVASNDVVLLEAGPAHAGPDGPPGEPVLDPALLRPGFEVIRRRGGAAEPYAQGFGLGGSSLVNGAVVVGDAGEWSRGHDLPVTPAADLGPIAAALVADASTGAAAVSLVARDGRRVTAAEGYLTPAVGRTNLTVRTDVAVRSLAFDGTRVIGVVTHDGGHLPADRVVLCAGAIGTPEVLLRSGVATAGVGFGLQDHLGVTLSFDLRRPEPSGVAIGATVEASGRQIAVMDRLPSRSDMGAVIAGVLRVGSVGRVTLPDHDGPALVELDQLGHPDDLAVLARVARDAIALLRSPVLAGLVGDVYADAAGRGIDDVTGDDVAFRRWLGAHLGGYHHLAGSCRVGVALDDDGSLRGYEGVFAADASALPGVPSRNPYLTVVRHAETLARRWTGRAGRAAPG